MSDTNDPIKLRNAEIARLDAEIQERKNTLESLRTKVNKAITATDNVIKQLQSVVELKKKEFFEHYEEIEQAIEKLSIDKS